MKMGDRVRFVLANDIEAIIIGTSDSATDGKGYQVAWIEAGKRETAWVAECEMEGGGNG